MTQKEPRAEVQLKVLFFVVHPTLALRQVLFAEGR
jgi:hypothetical protein